MTKKDQTKIVELEQRIAVLEKKVEAMQMNSGYSGMSVAGGGWL